MNRAPHRTARLAALGALIALILIALSGAAVAEPDFKKAAMHYKDAEVAMDKKEYKIAAREYGIAYEITKDPVLFFKIAAANDAAGNCDAALVYYKRYLREGNPNEEFRTETTSRITRCEGTPAAGSGPKDPVEATGTTPEGTATGAAGTAGTTDSGATTGTAGTADSGATAGTTGPGTGEGAATGATGAAAAGAADPLDDDFLGLSSDRAVPSFFDDKPSWKRTAGWVAVAATVAFATTGAVLGLSASSREEDLQNLLDFRDPSGEPAAFDGNTRERYEELIDEGETLDRYAKIAWIATGATAAAAVVFFALDATSAKRESEAPVSGRPTLTPVVSDDGFGLAGSWRF